ncbi:MAG TPA: PQQ-dependent sugar dehydrogenase [Flavitalea sp.]|nr:PQQ-dependent sugar dehydrogenase [Flavitalea sp.]
MRSVAVKILLVVFISSVSTFGFTNDSTHIKHRYADDIMLKLPQGFTSVSIAENVGKNRHVAVGPNGDLYVKLGQLKNGKGIIVLKETNGKAKAINSFGDFGGTGIAIKNGYVYASNNQEVFRFKLNDKGTVDPSQKAEKIVTGLISRRQHEAKPITLDNEGNIYVTIGAPSNSCQVKDREKGSMGQDPCSLLDSTGGIWQFKADKLNQTYKDGVRYATGIRNAMGIEWNDEVNDLYATQHGRDGLFQMFPEMYDEKQGAELPAEEMLRVRKGSDFGWPYCYYDQMLNKKILAPEYGGDKTKQGRCEGVETPVVAFPGHWAPNDIIFYTGNQFPEKYRHGAFIAFHGSWNRAPLKQQGYKVVFVPLKDGQLSGEYEVFADGFIGAPDIDSPDEAKSRPCGLAQAADGSLYISDSVTGHIWKISYKGQ